VDSPYAGGQPLCTNQRGLDNCGNYVFLKTFPHFLAKNEVVGKKMNRFSLRDLSTDSEKNNKRFDLEGSCLLDYP
jgi:hypothetical protein